MYGRPRVTPRRQDLYIETRATRALFITVTEIDNDIRTTVQSDTTLLQLQFILALASAGIHVHHKPNQQYEGTLPEMYATHGSYTCTSYCMVIFSSV
jgi:hypothetical protein